MRLKAATAAGLLGSQTGEAKMSREIPSISGAVGQAWSDTGQIFSQLPVPTLAAVGILLNISQQASGSFNSGALVSLMDRARRELKQSQVAAGRRIASSRLG